MLQGNPNIWNNGSASLSHTVSGKMVDNFFQDEKFRVISQ
jgi:hypothetical protein